MILNTIQAMKNIDRSDALYPKPATAFASGFVSKAVSQSKWHQRTKCCDDVRVRMGHSAGFPVTVSLVARRHPAFCFVNISVNDY